MSDRRELYLKYQNLWKFLHWFNRFDSKQKGVVCGYTRITGFTEFFNCLCFLTLHTELDIGYQFNHLKHFVHDDRIQSFIHNVTTGA
jgi:hypothetical protein